MLSVYLVFYEFKINVKILVFHEFIFPFIPLMEAFPFPIQDEVIRSTMSILMIYLVLSTTYLELHSTKCS